MPRMSALVFVNKQISFAEWVLRKTRDELDRIVLDKDGEPEQGTDVYRYDELVDEEYFFARLIQYLEKQQEFLKEK